MIDDIFNATESYTGKKLGQNNFFILTTCGCALLAVLASYMVQNRFIDSLFFLARRDQPAV